MAKFRATCEHVQDGDTFRTAGGNWIRLANVCAPELNELGGTTAKSTLSRLVLGQTIIYEQVGFDRGRLVAEVWVDGTHVNAYMRRQGYTCS